MYTIRIKDLMLHTTLGIYEWEKKQPRPVILNITLQIDNDRATLSDNIEDAVDYALLEQALVKKFSGTNYNLIEKLVADIGVFLLSLDKNISQITVEADKPGALEHARSVSIIKTFER